MPEIDAPRLEHGQGWADQRGESFRCRKCQKKLAMTSPQQALLKPGSWIEIKCACKTLNYLMGA